MSILLIFDQILDFVQKINIIIQGFQNIDDILVEISSDFVRVKGFKERVEIVE